jgi:hypothetical protein
MIKIDNLPKTLNKEETKEKLQSICEKNDVVFLGLFGSFVKGKQTKKSDIDMIVKFDKSKKKSLLDLIHTESELKKILRRKVDLLTPESLSPYLKENILKSTRVIYERRQNLSTTHT